MWVAKDFGGNVVTNVLSTVTRGFTWSEPVATGQYNEALNLDLHGTTHYTEYIWEPTETDNKNDTNNFGIMEIELLMSTDISDTNQYVCFEPYPSNEFVEVTVSPKSKFGSLYKTGTQLTLTAVSKKENMEFIRWYGSGFGDTVQTNPLEAVFTVGEINNAAPFYSGMWLLEWDEVSRREDCLTGKKSGGVGSAYTGNGSGTLELNGPVVNVNDSSDIWKITDFGKDCLSLSEDKATILSVTPSVTELYLPTNTMSISKMMFSQVTDDTLKYLWIYAPELASHVARPGPEWLKYGVMYQIQPRAFTPGRKSATGSVTRFPGM